jgi:dTMP kinase
VATTNIDGIEPSHDLRAVLRVPAFRRLWMALGLSSFGDWLGLLAVTALARRLGGSYAEENFAVAGVLMVRLLPGVIFGPLAGVIADRFDRRWTMVVCDVIRGSLFLSIPLVNRAWWLFAATLLIELATLFWAPAKEASVPNLLPPTRLEAANQLSLVATYGSAPIAAAVFTGLTLIAGLFGSSGVRDDRVMVALYVNAATFGFSALTIARLRILSSTANRPRTGGKVPSVAQSLLDGWSFIRRTPVIRGLVTGMFGAFGAGGAVVGLAPTYVEQLGAGEPGYGVLFGGVFCGLAAGMVFAPRLLRGLSRRRMFGLALTAAGPCLIALGVVPNFVLAVVATTLLGVAAGVTWVTGYTLLGLEVADELRGRTFAFVQSMVRVTLVAALAIAPGVAAAIGRREIAIGTATRWTVSGASVVFLAAGLTALTMGVVAYRHMDDRPGVPLFTDLAAAWRHRSANHRDAQTGDISSTGVFIAFEGGDGAGKSTQAALLATWLREQGRDVVLTHEPGATSLGKWLRDALLDTGRDHISARAEALLFAADRAEHVAAVIRPALDRGAVVITDRYMDSSIVYQGAGRGLPSREIEQMSRWAADGLIPQLTVLLDAPPALALERSNAEPDRMESEPISFHERVYRGFRVLASREPHRYLVLPGGAEPSDVAHQVRERIELLLGIEQPLDRDTP